MEKLYIKAENGRFVLRTENSELTNLVIKNKKGVSTFNKIDSLTWYVEVTDVANLMTKDQEDRVNIYYGDDSKEISIDDFDIQFANSPQLLANDTVIYLYITLDKTLRFIWNQIPSAKSYVKNCKISNSVIKKNHLISFKVDVESYGIPINNLDFIISNRKEKFQFDLKSKWLESRRVEPNVFFNAFEVTIDFPQVLKTIITRFDYDDYDTTVIDFFITTSSEMLPLTNFKSRIIFTDLFNEETWLDYSDNMKVLVRWYETGLGNLSCRIGFLKKDIYSYFKEKENSEIIDSENTILITEYPYKAQENGLAFFKYLMEEQNTFKPIYIISRASNDLHLLEKYLSNVVFYKSKEHIDYFFKANFLAHTHTPNYAIPVLSASAEQKIKGMYKLFLQHGIIGVRNLEYMYGRKTHPNLINKFIVSSEREKSIVRDELYYPEEDIAVTGLARFDNLLKDNGFFESYKVRKKVLIMPSWRMGQEKLSDEDFIETTFYKVFHSLINNARLRKLVLDKGITIDLYLHNNFQKYNHLFTSDFVNIIKASDTTVQALLKGHGILITDFSSVGLDFAIQRRPVLYYQFDVELKEQRAEESSKNFLPGKIFHIEDDLINEIDQKVKRYKMDKEFKKLIPEKIYKYNDRNACKRIYETLKKSI